MSATALFRQLTAGITFDTKKFKSESEKFGLVKQEVKVEVKEEVELPDLKKVTVEVTEKLRKDEEKRQALAGGEESDDITVIGNIKTTNKKKKSKSKVTKAKIREVYTERLNRFRNVHGIHVTGTDVVEPFDSWWAATLAWLCTQICWFTKTVYISISTISTRVC